MTMHSDKFSTVHTYNVESAPPLWDPVLSMRGECLQLIANSLETLLHGFQIRLDLGIERVCDIFCLHLVCESRRMGDFSRRGTQFKTCIQFCESRTDAAHPPRGFQLTSSKAQRKRLSAARRRRLLRLVASSAGCAADAGAIKMKLSSIAPVRGCTPRHRAANCCCRLQLREPRRGGGPVHAFRKPLATFSPYEPQTLHHNRPPDRTSTRPRALAKFSPWLA